jgi:hypothetical protein
MLLAGECEARAAASARLFYGRAPAVQGCADEAELRRAIALRVGYDPIFPMAPNSVVVSITREGGQLVADVKLTNREGVLVGSRTLKGQVAQCAELTDTIALTVAIALDTNDKLTASDPPDGGGAPASPDVASNPTETAADGPAADSPPVAVAVPPLVAPASPQSDPDSSRAKPTGPQSWPHLELAAGITGAFPGISPASSLGGAGAIALRWSTLSVGLEGWEDLPASASAKGISDASVRTSMAGGGAAACLHFSDFFGCAVALVGSLHAQAYGVPGTSIGNGLEVLGGVRAGLEVPLALGVSLRVSLDLLADPIRPEVHASGVSLWQASLFAAASQLALVVRIP